MVAMVLLAQYSCELTLSIFDLMSLIDDDVLPVVFIEPQSILEDKVVCGDAHIPLGALHLLQDFISGGWVPPVDYFSD